MAVLVRSKLQSQTELNVPWLIALSEHFAECRTTPIRVRIAPQMPVEKIAELALKPHTHALGHSEPLRDIEILVVIREAADRPVM